MLQKSAHDSAPLWPADYSSFPRYVMTRLLGSWRETSVMADCLFITSGLPTRHPVPPHRGLRTEARPAGVSLGCQQVGDTHLNLSTFQRGSLCVQISISTVMQRYWIFLTTKLSQLCFWARFPLICICWKTWYFSLFWFLLIAPVTMRYKEISGQLLACKHGQFLSVNREEISRG